MVLHDSWDVIADTDGLPMAELWQKIDKSVWKDGVIQAGGWALDSAVVIDENEFLMTLEQRARNYVTHFNRAVKYEYGSGRKFMPLWPQMEVHGD